MPVIVACPSCGGKLRIADELRGQSVRCPACNHTFESSPPAPPEPRPVPQDLPLDLSLDEPSTKDPAPANDSPGLVGAVELKLSLDDEPATPAPPSPPSPPPPGSKRPRLAHEHDEDYPDILRRRGPRRDAETDRGAAVLSLGVISLACLMITCYPVGVILGLIAWLMGRVDLNKMNRGAMDDTGRGMTQAGWICGILGTLLNGLVTLACMGFIGFIFYTENHRPLPPPRPTVAPAPVPQWPPPNNQKGPARKF